MNTNILLSPKAVGRRYVFEALAAVLLFMLTMSIPSNLLLDNPGEPWRILIALIPMIPLAWLFFAYIRYLLRTDELIRRMHLTTLAISAGATLFLAMIWGCLEMVGLHRVDSWWVCNCFFGIWGIALFVLRRHTTGKWFGGWADP